MPKIKESIETSVINEHGEFVEKRANKTLSWGSEPSFIKLYLGDILYLKDMPKNHTPVLYEFLKHMTYAGDADGQIIYVNASMKRKISNDVGYKIGTVNNCLSDFVRSEIFIRIDTGTYLVNPFFFGKGDWQDISRLRLKINYDMIKGRTFQSVCEYKSPRKDDNIEGQLCLEELSATGTEG